MSWPVKPEDAGSNPVGYPVLKQILLLERTMRKINFIKTNDGRLNIFANNEVYTVGTDHVNYNQIVDAIKTDNDVALADLCNVSRSVNSFMSNASNGVASIVDGNVVFNGNIVHNNITKRIIDLKREGFPFEPMLRFLENLMQNPSNRAITELYGFLELEGLPLTDDGCFLAYKRVSDDWKDFHSRTMDNRVGQIVKMARQDVDDNYQNGCSHGLHAGSLAYVNEFNPGQGHLIVVKINPKNVVSIPKEDVRKLRCCEYEVVGTFKEQLNNACYTRQEYDDNYDEEEEGCAYSCCTPGNW